MLLCKVLLGPPRGTHCMNLLIKSGLREVSSSKSQEGILDFQESRHCGFFADGDSFSAGRECCRSMFSVCTIRWVCWLTLTISPVFRMRNTDLMYVFSYWKSAFTLNMLWKAWPLQLKMKRFWKYQTDFQQFWNLMMNSSQAEDGTLFSNAFLTFNFSYKGGKTFS